MVELDEERTTGPSNGLVLQDANQFVQQITRAMWAIAALYTDALSDERLNTSMLIGLLYLGKGAARSEMEPNFGFAICNAGEVVDRLLARGFISSDASGLLRPTAETQAVFSRLSRLAQQENLRWREQLQTMPGGNLLLDDFLTMLQTSHHA